VVQGARELVEVWCRAEQLNSHSTEARFLHRDSVSWTHSPKCLEGLFCELRIDGVQGSRCGGVLRSLMLVSRGSFRML
jgi:hypothetical protein